MGFWSTIFGGSSEQESTQEQQQAYDEYLDIRVEMIEASDDKQQWNALSEQANELRSQFTHEPTGGFWSRLFG
jgi:hypothetical protein